MALATLEGHTNKVTGALTLDGGRILSWSGFGDKALRLWDGATGAALATLEGHTSEVTGALALADGRILSWAGDNMNSWFGDYLSDHTCRLWDGATGTPLRVFADPRDWRDAEADLVASLRPDERAKQHSLHLGFRLAVAEGDRAVFKSGRHLRLCRFVGGRGTAKAGEASDLPDAG